MRTHPQTARRSAIAPTVSARASLWIVAIVTAVSLSVVWSDDGADELTALSKADALASARWALQDAKRTTDSYPVAFNPLAIEAPDLP